MNYGKMKSATQGTDDSSISRANKKKNIAGFKQAIINSEAEMKKIKDYLQLVKLSLSNHGSVQQCDQLPAGAESGGI